MRKRGTARRPWVGPGLAGGTRPRLGPGLTPGTRPHLGPGLSWDQASWVGPGCRCDGCNACKGAVLLTGKGCQRCAQRHLLVEIAAACHPPCAAGRDAGLLVRLSSAHKSAWRQSVQQQHGDDVKSIPADLRLLCLMGVRKTSEQLALLACVALPAALSPHATSVGLGK